MGTLSNRLHPYIVGAGIVALLTLALYTLSL